MSTEIWAALLERPLCATEERALLALLPPQRAERLARTKQAEKRQEALCAYALLLRALFVRRGWSKFPQLVLSERGKPRFPEYPEVHFSLSHTAGAVMAGVGDRPIGVDLERLRPVSERLLRRTGLPDENAFFCDWVRREAVVKQGDLGLASLMHPPAISQGVTCATLQLFSGYAAAAAWEGEEAPCIAVQSTEELVNGVMTL